MKVAVMQPYLFPYIGYFQMVSSVDIFIFYDTVDFPIRGWVNRNQILMNREAKRFTVPVRKSKLGTPINEVLMVDFELWKTKFLLTIDMCYKKAPNYLEAYNLLKAVLEKDHGGLITTLAENSIKAVSNYLELDVEFKRASDLVRTTNETKETKLEALLTMLSAEEIVLPPGSYDLYNHWNPPGVVKRTLQLPKVSYHQNQKDFINYLSIIDVMMFNDKDDINKMINTKCYR